MAPRPHSTVLFVSSAHPLAPWGPLSDADRSHWAAVEAAILAGDASSMLAALRAYGSTLPKEAAPRLTSFYGRALDSLIFANDPGCARALIDLMVSEDCPHGRTWVRSGASLAAQNGAEAVLIEILARIGDEFAQDTLATMLQYCAQTGKREGVRALLVCGADPETALRAVAQRCPTEALELLLSEAGPVSQELLYLIMLRDWNNPARTSSARTPLLLFAHGLEAPLDIQARNLGA